MNRTKISWTDYTWNPVTGCRKISPGCTNCYAHAFAERWRGVKGHPYEKGFDLVLHEDRLNQPYSWKKPAIVFVNSMSDLFLEEIPDDFIMKVFDVMSDTPHLTYQVLTKRPERMLQWLKDVYKKPWPKNVWIGVTVENDDTKGRIAILKATDAKVKFISFEPLISSINLTEDLLDGISWVIVGGESGPKARRMEKEWGDSIFRISRKLHIPFFFKQWGRYGEDGIKLKRGDHESNAIYAGSEYKEYPRE